MIRSILNSKSKTVAFSALLLAGSSLISRFLGLLRDRFLAGHFGAGRELDIYFAAFRIPDFVYVVLITGGITAAFLPIFSEYYQKESHKEKWSNEVTVFANNLLNAIFVSLIVICAVLAVFAPYVVKIVVPGFSSADKDLAINLTRLMFLSPILFGLSSIFSGILQYFDKFLIYSICPILYNIGIIIGILFFVPAFGIYGLAMGVILGAFLYLIIQIPPAMHSGFKYRPVFDFTHPGIRKIYRLTLPRLIGTATDQINLVVLTAIASILSSGSIAVFSFASNLQYLPVGIIGISFAVSSFPVFSKYLANGQKKEFFDNFSLSFRQVLYFIIPASMLLFLLRAQAVRLILGTGQFGWRDTRLTAAAVGLFCFGIVANSIIPLITKAFFASKDTKTPVVIAIISTCLNVSLCASFIFLLGFSNPFSNFVSGFLVLGGIEDIKIMALPMALSVASSLQLFLLLIFLYRKIGDFRFDKILKSFSKIMIASVLMFIIAYFVRQSSGGSVDMQTFSGVFIQTFLTSVIAIFIYLLLTLILKSPELGTFKNSIVSQIKKSDLGSSAK
jgi:putative peptidoglycan lipid II flippase